MVKPKRKTVVVKAKTFEELRSIVAKKYPSHVIDHVREVYKVFDVVLRPRER